MLLDDPTRGIDVGAKTEIHAVMHELASRGPVQIVASSDPLELATICDEVLVFYGGPGVRSAHRRPSHPAPHPRGDEHRRGCARSRGGAS